MSNEERLRAYMQRNLPDDPMERWEYLRQRSEPQPKQHQQTNVEATNQATQQRSEYVDRRIWEIVEEAAQIIAEESGVNERNLREQLQREIKQAIERKPKVIIFDPSESLKKLVTEYSAGLREELAEIRKELGVQRKGEVVDLPQLPRKRA